MHFIQGDVGSYCIMGFQSNQTTIEVCFLSTKAESKNSQWCAVRFNRFSLRSLLFCFGSHCKCNIVSVAPQLISMYGKFLIQGSHWWCLSQGASSHHSPIVPKTSSWQIHNTLERYVTHFCHGHMSENLKVTRMGRWQTNTTNLIKQKPCRASVGYVHCIVHRKAE